MKLKSVLCALTLLAACGNGAPVPADQSAPEAADTEDAASTTWFICDGIDAASLFLFEKPDATHVALTEYVKATGAPEPRIVYDLGPSEGAAGSIYTSLLQNGAEAGVIRQINPGMLETPGAAYTPPFSSIQLGERRVACRWMARTRLMGFTGRRSIVIYEDADGDLIYSSYNFPDATRQQPVELSGAQRSTPFSLEVRGGAEEVRPEGAMYRFANQGYTYTVTAPNQGLGAIEVRQGENQVQTEPLIAFQTGAGAATE